MSGEKILPEDHGIPAPQQYDNGIPGMVEANEGYAGQIPNDLFGDLPSREYGRSELGAQFSRQRLTMKRKESSPYGQFNDNANEQSMVSVRGQDMTDLTDLEDGMNPEVTDRNKELIKALPAPLARRRTIKRTHEHDMESRVKKLSWWKQFKLKTSMGWFLFRSRTKEFLYNLELWRGPLKEIEGHFGNGVLSYFLFLKSLLALNFLIFLVVFCFLTIPQILLTYDLLREFLGTATSSTTTQFQNVTTSNTTGNGTASAFKGCAAAVSLSGRSVGDKLLDFFTGQGYVNTTMMFYSNYAGRLLIGKDGLYYDMPLAYLLVGGAYFIVSLLHMVSNLASGFTDSVIESGGLFYSFCNKVFASWDYCITNERAALLKQKNILQDIEVELLEERRQERLQNRTRLQKCRLYLLRVFVSFIVMVFLGASVYAIIKAVEVSTDPTFTRQGNGFVTILARWASSLTITALNVILPEIFQLLTAIEDWSPHIEVAMSLWRAVLLKLASIAVLVITLYTRYNEHKCEQCWENQIGAQMFNLIWIDFFATAGSTILVETCRKYVAKYLTCGCELGKKIGMQEFDIPRNVLDLVYGQALVWIGTFFCPLITAIGVLKLFILFYVKKISLMKNCRPSSKPYQGARSNYFFTLLLLLTFLLCVVGVGWGITRIAPSCCGPFSNTECDSSLRMLKVVANTIAKWPGWVQQVFDFLETPAFLAPVLLIICLILYYFRSMTLAHEKMIEMLKDQLVMEGRDKRFLMQRLLAFGHTQQFNQDEPALK